MLPTGLGKAKQLRATPGARNSAARAATKLLRLQKLAPKSEWLAPSARRFRTVPVEGARRRRRRRITCREPRRRRIGHERRDLGRRRRLWRGYRLRREPARDPAASTAHLWQGARVLILQNEMPETINIAAAPAARAAGATVCVNAAPYRPMSDEFASSSTCWSSTPSRPSNSAASPSPISPRRPPQQSRLPAISRRRRHGRREALPACGGARNRCAPGASRKLVSTHGAGEHLRRLAGGGARGGASPSAKCRAAADAAAAVHVQQRLDRGVGTEGGSPTRGRLPQRCEATARSCSPAKRRLSRSASGDMPATSRSADFDAPSRLTSGTEVRRRPGRARRDRHDEQAQSRVSAFSMPYGRARDGSSLQADSPYRGPFAPGGSTDVIGRVVAEGRARCSARTWPWKSCRGRRVGMAAIAAAPPDGATHRHGHCSTLAINPATYKESSVRCAC